MTRLKSILGCDDALELHEKYDGCVFRTIRAVEQAVLAKLAKQEPVAWTSAEIMSDPSFVDDDDYAVMCKTKSHLLDDFCGYPEATPVPLYTHPQTEMQKPFTPRNAAEMRDFIGMHFGSLSYANPETEEPSDDDWYTLSIHDLLSSFSWAGYYDHEGLSTASRDATTPDGWQLVPVEPDPALLTSMATCLNHGFGLLTKEKQDGQLYEMRKLYDEVVGKGYYSPKTRERYLAMLAAAPKYTGDK